MKQHILTLVLVCTALSLFGQFRMVGTVSGSWTTVNATTYTGTVNFQSDLTGQSYLATAIVDTFRLFTPTEQMYRVDSVWNKTFSSASMRLVRTNGTGAPSGQVLVFDPNGRTTIPQNPFGSTGATAQLNAAVDAWNARQIRNTTVTAGTNVTVTGTGTLVDPYVVNSTASGASVAFDALTSGNVSAQVTRIGGTATTIANPAAGEYNFVVQSGAHLNAISLFGNNTTLNASNEMIIRINNSANSRDRRVSVQLYDANNNALVDQQVTATVNTQSVSGNITVITIPGLNGFAAPGFWVEIR